MAECFTIFEGGGAKGITHLGAMKALEEAGFGSIGVAGTSAGAIIAALASVGYRADELFDPVTGRNILADHGHTPTALLGDRDWRAFRKVFPKARSEAAQAVVDLMLGIAQRVVLLLEPFWIALVVRRARRTRRPPLLGGLWELVESFGFFSTCHARDILNGFLRDRLRRSGAAVPDLIRFKDIDPVRGNFGIPLKIIATNLDSQGLELFDASRPEVVVADAVAASFAIPLFFKPATVREVDDAGRETLLPARFADGGLVSNLPIWAFAEEKRTVERSDTRRMARPLPIIAFTLKEAATPPRATALQRVSAIRQFTRFGVNVLRTGIFGAQSVASRFVPNLTIVDLPSPLGLVQFDCSLEEARSAFHAGRKAALNRLQDVFQVYPFARQQGLQEIVDIARDLSDALRLERDVAPVGQFRACLIRKLSIQFKVVQGFNMDGDTDDDLLLDQGNPGAPTAFALRAFRPLHFGPNTNLIMTKYEQALVRRSLASVLSFPIFDSTDELAKPPSARDVPRGVLCIDSDTSLRLEAADKDFTDRLAAASVRFAPLMEFEGQT